MLSKLEPEAQEKPEINEKPAAILRHPTMRGFIAAMKQSNPGLKFSEDQLLEEVTGWKILESRIKSFIREEQENAKRSLQKKSN